WVCRVCVTRIGIEGGFGARRISAVGQSSPVTFADRLSAATAILTLRNAASASPGLAAVIVQPTWARIVFSNAILLDESLLSAIGIRSVRTYSLERTPRSVTRSRATSVPGGGGST